MQNMMFPQSQTGSLSFKLILVSFFFIFFAILSIAVILKLYNPLAFPIRQVVIQGDLPPVYHEAAAQATEPFTHDSFFAVGLSAIQARLQKFPWVAQAKVRRVWPNQVVVDVTMQQPIAYWNENSLLNVYGEIFDLGELTVSQDLPHFSGPENYMLKVLDYYAQMNKILEPLNLKVSSIVLSLSQSWSIVLNNGTKVRLGQDQCLTRLRRFVKVYAKINASHTAQAKEIDLRYSHGMAVKW